MASSWVPARIFRPGCETSPFEDGPTMPARSLLLNFDPPPEVPEEFALKADRYGWPRISELIPVFLMVDGREPGQSGVDDVRALTVALTAMIEPMTPSGPLSSRMVHW
jgi:hypothetical protein